MTLFAGFAGAHGTHGMPDRDPESLKWAIKRTARTLREPVTLDLWRQHVAGKRPLGVIPIREDATCYWGSIDYDKYDAGLLEIVDRVNERGLPLVSCRSKSGGLHLFLFLRDPQPAGAVIAVLRNLAASLGIAGSEIFPKQVEVLADRGDMGNWMVMPYFGSTYEGRLQEQVGLKRTGAEMRLEEFLNAAERARLPAADFEALAATRAARGAQPATRKVGGRGAAAAPTSAGPFADGPPCLQHLALNGIPAGGGRNNVLLMMGIYLQRRDEANWRDLLDEYNRAHMSPPLGADEVASTIRSLERRQYEYTCRTEPMASHCNSAVCRTRRFGVGAAGAYPAISGLSKLDTEPPIWFVDVEDARLEITTEDLQNYMRFHRICMERLNRCFQLMKQADWLQGVAAAMENVTLIDAPRDVGEPERFRELLEEFLTNRQRGEQREDILSGRPWEDEEAGLHYFRLRDLQAFLEREGLKGLARTRITRRIEALGGGHYQFNIKGRFTNVWYVPTSVAQEVPEVNPPPVPNAPI